MTNTERIEALAFQLQHREEQRLTLSTAQLNLTSARMNVERAQADLAATSEVIEKLMVDLKLINPPEEVPPGPYDSAG